jgi:two-component system sensor histidine kinase UhpB
MYKPMIRCFLLAARALSLAAANAPVYAGIHGSGSIGGHFINTEGHLVTLPQVLFFALQTALIVGLLIQWRRAAAALAQANEQLRCSGREINKLGGRLISAQENERRRISRELHDDLSQQVAALAISLSAVKRDLSRENGAGERIAEVQKRLASLSDSIRHFSHELHPAVLEHCGLSTALKAHCEEFQAFNHCTIEMSISLHSAVPFDVAICLYRITQETLRNAAKHSGSDAVWIFLIETDGCIQLTIRDAGKGFDVDEQNGCGLGLINMKERARLAGGSFEVYSAPNLGTVTRVFIPLEGRRVTSV